MKTVSKTEIWGLRRPDGMILYSGYSESSLHSEEAVRRDFDKSLFEQGFVPVLVKTIKTTTKTY